jgi:glucokinase
MILAGDIGGTHVRLALYEPEGASLRRVGATERPSASLEGLTAGVEAFLAAHARPGIEAACFGVAGPVEGGRAKMTNLPWWVDAAELSTLLAGAKVRVLNDLEATAIGLLHLPPSRLAPLLPGAPPSAPANRAVIAAGTGLGEALLVWDGARYLSVATEGGHADFAPRTPLEQDLARALADRGRAHVSVEAVLSGDGISAIHDFLAARGEHAREPRCACASAPLGSERNRAITDAAIRGGCALCRAALSLFAGVYGAEAGNLALRSMARAGIYLAGGIAPNILPALRGPEFREAFLSKGRFRSFMEKVPVHVCLDTDVALLGAAETARLAA